MDVVSPLRRTLNGSTRATGAGAHKPLYKHLYIQVLIGIALGVVFGLVAPRLAVQMKPLGDAFIKLIQMLIAPIVFATVVVGVARMGDMKEVGRIGLKTIAYFEIVTTLALAIGLIVVNVLRPGAGMNVDPNALDTSGIQTYTTSAQHLSAVETVLNIIPQTAVGAFTNGDILQVLLFSILFGAALARLGERGRQMIGLIDELGHVLFGMVRMIMYLAPIGAFGAIA
ncbi:MAG: cation:dicarboxylase symporter family transporter, partial [Chloroflexi bacterium]|nr:cation:dicarboxylase symporter family transporter [Chloroflexota bacterium]